MSVRAPVGGPMGAGAGPAAPRAEVGLGIARAIDTPSGPGEVWAAPRVARGKWVQLARPVHIIKGLNVEMILKGERERIAGILSLQDRKIYAPDRASVYALASEEVSIQQKEPPSAFADGYWKEVPRKEFPGASDAVFVYIQPKTGCKATREHGIDFYNGYYNLQDHEIYAIPYADDKVSKVWMRGNCDIVIPSEVRNFDDPWKADESCTLC